MSGVRVSPTPRKKADKDEAAVMATIPKARLRIYPVASGAIDSDGARISMIESA